MTPASPTHRSKPPGGVFGAVRRFIDGAYIDRAGCDRAFERMHQRDAIGDRIHLILGIGGLLCLFGPVTMTEIALIPMMVFFFVRVINTFPVWIHGFGQPVVLGALLIAGWMGVSLLWSPDPAQGLREIAELRWLALIGFFFPIMEHRLKLVLALGAGLLLGQIGQVLDFYNGFGIEPLARLVENHPGRISGWWHPVVGADLLVAGMGLHLPAALLGRGRIRVLGMLGFFASGVGVLATGTRGAWVAAALLVCLALVMWIVISRAPIRRVMVFSVFGLGVLVLGSLLMRQSLTQRIQESSAEIRAIQDGEYGSYSGRRLMMAQDAIGAFEAHPVVGIGAGGFEHWCAEHRGAFGAHAHNSTLHTLATLGIIGLGLWLLLIVVLLVDASRLRIGPDDDNPYRLGPMLAIAGLLLASISDSIHINAQSAALLGVLAALSPAYVPSTRRRTEPHRLLDDESDKSPEAE